MCIDEIDNEIGPDGAQHLSDALRKNSSLLYLNIIGKCFSSSLFAFLFQYLFVTSDLFSGLSFFFSGLDL